MSRPSSAPPPFPAAPAVASLATAKKKGQEREEICVRDRRLGYPVGEVVCVKGSKLTWNWEKI